MTDGLRWYTDLVAIRELSSIQRRALVAMVLVAIAAAVSCSVITSSTDYRNAEPTAPTTTTATGTGGSGGAADASGDGDLPDNTLGRVFVAGGDRDGIDDYEVAVVDLWVTEILEDGTIGPWRVTTPPPYGGRFGLNIIDDKLFAVGRSPSVSESSRYLVMAAPLTQDGVGEWVGVSDDDRNWDRDIVFLVSDCCAFAIGGSYTYEDDAGTHTGFEDDALMTALDPDVVVIQDWNRPQEMNTGRREVGAMLHDGYLWAIGGYRWDPRADVEVAVHDSVSRSLDPFYDLRLLGEPAADGGTDEHGVISPAVCGSGSHIYVIGGEDSLGPSPVVMRADFDPTQLDDDAGAGPLTAWQAESSLPGGLEAAACVVLGDWLYVIGGLGPSSRSDEVLVATIGSDGSLGPWQVSDHRLPFGRSHHAATVLAAE